MPCFLVIAGPNGAGKSTFSTFLSRTDAVVFDPDKVKFEIEHQYPDIGPDAIESALTNAYRKFELAAIDSRLNLTVETNLRNEFLVERAGELRKTGYETRIIYMLLPDVETSMDRVNLRVKQKGHFVDPESIAGNFKTGLENFKKVAWRFDQIMLLSAMNSHLTGTQPQLLLTVKNGITQYKSPILPAWCKDFVTEIEQITRDLHQNQG